MNRAAISVSILLAALALPAHAAYPDKPVRLIVPAAAGGGADIVARAIGPKLSDKWGQPVIVDNRNGILGPEIAAKAEPDGYTLMLAPSSLIVREAVYRNLPFNVMRDFAPVTHIIDQSNVLSVSVSLQARTVPELIAYARARPGQLNYASGGNGTSNHLAGELFNYLARVKIVHVPYKGVAQGLLDVIGGRIQMSFTSPVAAMTLGKDGKLRILAVTTAKRAKSLPAVPTLAEAGLPGYEFTGWMGLFAPARSPDGAVLRLHEAVAGIIGLREIGARLEAGGAEVVGNGPRAFRPFVDAEIRKMKSIVQLAGIRVE